MNNNIVLKIFFILTFGIPLFHSCGIWDPAPAREVSTNVQERAQKALEEGKGISNNPIKDGRYEHGCDAFRYFILNRFPIRSNFVGRLPR